MIPAEAHDRARPSDLEQPLNRIVYLDNAATTPVDPRVRDRMFECLTIDGDFGNSASTSHQLGWEAADRVEAARVQVARLINADPMDIVWTSGASESDNLAIKGVMHDSERRHVVTSAYEHKAVLDACAFLESEGCRVTYVRPGLDGVVDPAEVAEAIRPDTCLVSIMHANNEVGTVNDVAGISRICADRDVLLHVDAAQSVGKIPVDVRKLGVHLLSVSAHKLYGPKGVGILFVRKGLESHICPLVHGGGHERGLRSGTLATHQVVGMGEAAAICHESLAVESERIADLRRRLWSHLAQIPGSHLNGSGERSVPGILNVAFEGIDEEVVLRSLDDVAISSGSACTSTTVEPSHVLLAMGVRRDLAACSFRFSIGRFNSEDDILHAGNRLAQILDRLRSQRVAQTG